MRVATAVLAVLLWSTLTGCGGADDPAESVAEGATVTFRGTAEADSMAPTIKSGDRVIATEVGPSGPSVGDIVVYTNPGRWLAGRAEGEGQLVHRVMGTPGDTLTCCDPDGRLSVNGEPIDEPYLAPDPGRCNATLLGGLSGTGDLRGECDWSIGPVPDGSLFVLGDNRDSAADSRFHLCRTDPQTCPEPWVPIDLVRGIVVLPQAQQA